LQDIDSRRAFQLWSTANQIRELTGFANMTNRRLIEIVQRVEGKMGIPIKERGFPTSTTWASLEQSVSRGKVKLGITGYWESDLCKKISAI
jgi:hypothetical protein